MKKKTRKPYDAKAVRAKNEAINEVRERLAVLEAENRGTTAEFNAIRAVLQPLYDELKALRAAQGETK